MKPLLHFSHANGYPAKSYTKLFSLLEPDYDIGYIEKHAHNPNYPIENNWEKLVQELIDFVHHNYTSPVIGVGHSLGGMLTFKAAYKAPELFKHVIMIDAPVLSRPSSLGVQLLKKLGYLEHVTPGKRTKQRKSTWSSRKDALRHFETHPVYKYWDKECLQDYITYGTQTANDGSCALSFLPENEYSIYITIPDNLYHISSYPLPLTVIYGERNSVINTMDMKSMQKKLGATFVKAKGGHLLPFEHPIETAQLLHEIIQKQA